MSNEKLTMSSKQLAIAMGQPHNFNKNIIYTLINYSNSAA